MNDLIIWPLCFIGGLVIGAVFFGGLWWTVQRGVTATSPATWFLTSLIARMAFAMTGFSLIAEGHLDRITMCLVGFLVARFIVSAKTRAFAHARKYPKRGA